MHRLYTGNVFRYKALKHKPPKNCHSKKGTHTKASGTKENSLINFRVPNENAKPNRAISAPLKSRFGNNKRSFSNACFLGWPLGKFHFVFWTRSADSLIFSLTSAFQFHPDKTHRRNERSARRKEKRKWTTNRKPLTPQNYHIITAHKNPIPSPEYPSSSCWRNSCLSP